MEVGETFPLVYKKGFGEDHNTRVMPKQNKIKFFSKFGNLVESIKNGSTFASLGKIHWAADKTYDKDGEKKICKQFALETPQIVMNFMRASPYQREPYENTQPKTPLCFMFDVDYKYGEDGELNDEECLYSLENEIIPSVDIAWKEMGFKSFQQMHQNQ